MFNKINRNERKYLKRLVVETDNIFSTKQETIVIEEINNYSREEIISYLIHTASKTLGMTPYKTQIMGALTLIEGNVAEMQTGEGKTLTSVIALGYKSLLGSKNYLLTTNDYLAERDYNFSKPFFNELGITTSLNTHQLSKNQKLDVYKADIIYSTHATIGFDYLNDSTVDSTNEILLKNKDFCIIDEVDSILIDDAKVPLIISESSVDNRSKYLMVNDFVAKLELSEDYVVDSQLKVAILTEKGVAKIEKSFNLKNLYSPENKEFLYYLNISLTAQFVLVKGIDYIIKDSEIALIDTYTGRTLLGRQLSNGLHQGLQAKEGLTIQKVSETKTSITYPNLFKTFSNISGMTGTAYSEKDEFAELYNMLVIRIPRNKPSKRMDLPDEVYLTKEYKFKAVANNIIDNYNKGYPILVGTGSVEDSEKLSNILLLRNVPHVLLNAKNPEKEADIISKAGLKNNVTIATNMAGRGTDIKVDTSDNSEIGLYVIGTERFESRRIDNQLRGRTGRQGEFGITKMFSSLEDDLLLNYGSKNVQDTLRNSPLGSSDKLPKIFKALVDESQLRVEINNFNKRKGILMYDSVIEDIRKDVFKVRLELLKGSETGVTPNYVKEFIPDNAVFSEEMLDASVQHLDFLWSNFLRNTQALNESVQIRGYGGLKPFDEFYRESFEMYKEMSIELQDYMTSLIAK